MENMDEHSDKNIDEFPSCSWEIQVNKNDVLTIEEIIVGNCTKWLMASFNKPKINTQKT